MPAGFAPARAVLLASHGTPGARAAEALAFELCAEGGRVHHLVVVPEFWKGMLGDDWLNNAVVHVRFGRYVENQLEREIAEHGQQVEAEAKRRGLGYACETRLGDPAECLAEVAAAGTHELVVIGSPRPKGAPGYRSRLAVEKLVARLRLPLIVAPHPGR
ncbi:MAG: universal stress protein [Alphaproteobacteria bacterium]|nr:universal stress protein [Alphaproteobacteria bacterium]